MGLEHSGNSFLPRPLEQFANYIKAQKEIKSAEIASRTQRFVVGGLMTLIPNEVRESGFLENPNFFGVVDNLILFQGTFNDRLDYSLSHNETVQKGIGVVEARETKFYEKLKKSLTALNPLEANRLSGLVQDYIGETECIEKSIRAGATIPTVAKALEYRRLVNMILECATISVILGEQRTSPYTKHIEAENLSWENIYQKYSWIFEGVALTVTERAIIVMERVAAAAQIGDDWHGIDLDKRLNVPSIAIAALNYHNENKKEAKNDLNSLERHFIKEAKKYGLNPLAAEGVTFGLKFSCGLVKNCLNFAKRHHTSLLENEWYQSVWVKAEMLRRERDYIEGKL